MCWKSIPEGLAALLGERGAVPGVVLDHDLADGTRAREALGQRGLVHRREPEVREDAIEGAAKSPGAIPTAMVASESFFEKGAMELAEVVPREEIARGLPVDPRAAVDVAGVVERRAHLDGVGQRLLDDRGPVALRTLRRQQDAIDDVDDTISRLDVRLDDARLADPDLKHHRLAAQRLDAAGGEQILREDAAVHDVESEHGLQAVPVLGTEQALEGTVRQGREGVVRRGEHGQGAVARESVLEAGDLHGGEQRLERPRVTSGVEDGRGGGGGPSQDGQERGGDRRLHRSSPFAMRVVDQIRFWTSRERLEFLLDRNPEVRGVARRGASPGMLQRPVRKLQRSVSPPVRWSASTT
jgi:hypothetical protein